VCIYIYEIRFPIKINGKLIDDMSYINLLAPELFFLILAHPVYKM